MKFVVKNTQNAMLTDKTNPNSQNLCLFETHWHALVLGENKGLEDIANKVRDG